MRFNRVTQLNGIQWRYDIHGRTVEKDNGQTRWRYRYDGEHRLTDVISQPRDRNKPQVEVSFRYDPLGRRISKTRRQFLAGQPTGKAVTTRFVWEGFRLLQEIHDGVPLTYVYSDPHSYEPLARIDGTQSPDIYWFHNQPNGTPERLTDVEGRLRWEGRNSAWGKLAHESTPLPTGYHQNLRMQGQYLDRETGLHYNLFRYYDPDCGRFTQHDPIGLAGGINLYQFAPNALGWVDPWGLSNSGILDRAMDGKVGDRLSAHHVIPVEVWKENQAFFDKIGIGKDMNSAFNGIHVPGSASAMKADVGKGMEVFHSSNHHKYSDIVRQRIANIQDRYNAGRINAKQARIAVRRIQIDMKNKIWMRHIPTTKCRRMN